VRWLVLALIFSTSSFAHAQRNGSSWLNLDYTYSNLTYKESAMTESGNFAGIRGELGIALTSLLAVSVGGEYKDGNLDFSGTTLTGTSLNTVTKDYFRDTRAMLNFLMGSAVLSAGIAQREWYDNLVVAYRRREIYNYYPTTLTLYRDSIYVKLEYDIWNRGTAKAYMSDVSSSEQDVSFTQGSGSGYGVEVGYSVGNMNKFATRIYIAYQRWNIGDSNTQNDNVYNLTIPNNNTVNLQAGLGIGF
jgi:hypothetical protein